MALQNVVRGTSVRAEFALAAASTREIGRRLLTALVKRIHDLFDPVLDSYRPELHYMRGPGPRWREKHGMTARNRRG
jgi:hypothetical protein